MNIDTKINRNFVRVVVEKSLLICHGLPYEAGSVIEKSYSDLARYFALKGFNSVIFDFFIPKGCYATVLLREFTKKDFF